MQWVLISEEESRKSQSFALDLSLALVTDVNWD